ncbi:MAG: efflux transporter periplasmic adaptor subunit [Sulfurimonas sp. RIFOXYD12_FULL_33_39]|uniref:efflux RND transporter periplasmic adaptor subunit n=1 Tax=unclassified Sulfurimonas TaxID=2623549 RepID=UPI0008B5080D|nr:MULTISPECIES: efflux RND transporter periplasmic adaptor subunit [unclassified Sulfurimonas]OHE10170.1 MAG: efflux transporter periplasmic adaptor subunit [Sulfurimonas sp. RIFOXYD12_FULL_33_39]OHE14609.1 MAG: efflux transporter periplasmic adaptor subunit [Sulfurimonas sp. RIFOXYD2_FULL_34_21]DAB27433.1 MAG TPA: efflux transporter periplasmic adaptor subunit [Sulfurimonas sp. UBA10385]
MKKIIIGLMSLVLMLGAEDIYANFHIEAIKSANLAFDASGVVKKVHVDVSSRVKKGDRLAELYNDDKKASLNIAKASLERAKVAMKFAKKDYERQEIIKHLIDQALFDKYAQNYESAKAALVEAEANLSYQEALYEKTVLYAPFDGVIFEKIVEEGDVVSGMMLRTIFKIQSLSERKLLLDFDQKNWQKVQINQKFKYRVDGDKKEYEGVITKIYPHVNDTNRKLNAEVKANDFIVGLFGEGYIHVPAKE